MSDCPTGDQDETADSSSARALLVRGIPLSQPGRGTAKAIKDALRAIVVSSEGETASAGSKTTDWSNNNKQQRSKKFDCNVQFSLTVHRRVRNGCAVLIFPTPSQAQHVLQLIQAKDKSSLVLVQWPHLLPEQQQQQQTPPLLPVHIGGAAGRLRDHAFPDLPYSIRSQIRLDFTATYSLSDSGVANRMATLFRWMHAHHQRHRKIRVLDAMACVGGNAIGMLRRSSNASLLGSHERENHRLLIHHQNDDNINESPSVRLPPEIGHVVAVERDPDRFKLLEHNVNLVASETTGNVAQLSTRCGCCFDYIAESMEEGESFDVVFFDPEWGGPEYKRRETELSPEQADEELGFYVSLSQQAADRLHVLHEQRQDDLSKVPLESIILAMIRLEVATVISVALPRTKVGDRAMQRLANGVTSDIFNNSSEQRPFPFVFNFGSTVQLLVLASGGDAFVDMHLDQLVHQIQREWHPKDGVGEHRPRFFDYEKNRWIELKKWISTTRTCEAAVETI